jgi:cytochrome c
MHGSCRQNTTALSFTPALCINMTQLLKPILAAGLAVLAGSTAAAGDAEAGRVLYQARCTACHSLDYNGVGPAHRGVFGRAAGRAPGFSYSDALKSSHQIWNEDSLDRWLADPEKFAPGQRMGLSVPQAEDRRDLIAFLKQITPSPK